jgi:hypothetical protein
VKGDVYWWRKWVDFLRGLVCTVITRNSECSADFGEALGTTHSNQHFGITNARDWSTYWCCYHGTCDCQYGRIHVCNCTMIFGILGDWANVDTPIVGSASAIGGRVCSYWLRWSCWFIWYDKSFWYSHFVVTEVWTVSYEAVLLLSMSRWK